MRSTVGKGDKNVTGRRRSDAVRIVGRRSLTTHLCLPWAVDESQCSSASNFNAWRNVFRLTPKRDFKRNSPGKVSLKSPSMIHFLRVSAVDVTRLVLLGSRGIPRIGWFDRRAKASLDCMKSRWRKSREVFRIPFDMRLGIFAKTFVRPDLASTLDAVAACGLDCVQFNFACAGLASLPEKIDPRIVSIIAGELGRRRISVAAVSGTFNMIHPDPAQRREGLRRLNEIAASCAELGAPMITLCTGTRDAEDMWRAHPQNDSVEAWQDLLVSLEEALKIADKHDVYLGVEPETVNVVNSARRARRLLDEMDLLG